MGVIFTASADSHSYQHSSALFEPLMRWLFPHISAERMDLCHHYFRKCAHLTEYGIFALLVWRAIHQPRPGLPKPWLWKEMVITLAVVFLYSTTDEYHQSFVPTRTPLFSDCLIDTTGGALALAGAWALRKLRSGKRQ